MKLKLKIMNILYFVISAAAIVFLSITPLCEFKVTCHVDQEVIDEIVDEEVFEEFGVTSDDLFAGDIEFDINVDIKIGLFTALRGAFGLDHEEYVNRIIILPSTKSTIDELEPVLKQIANNGVKALMRNLFTEELANLTDTENFYPVLAAQGFSEADVQESIDAVIESVFDAYSVGIVADKFAEEYNRYSTKINGKTKTGASYKDFLQVPMQAIGIAEDGYALCTIDECAMTILQGFIGERPLSKEEKDAINGKNDDDEDDDDDFGNYSGYKNVFTKEFIEFVDANWIVRERETAKAYQRIWGFTIVGLIVWGALIAGWILKIVKLFICLFRKTPYLRTSPYGIASGILQVIIAVVSIGSIVLFTIGPANVATLPIVGGVFKNMPLKAYYQLTFSAMIPGLLYILNCLLSLVYNPVKKRFKNEVKKEAESFLDIE